MLICTINPTTICIICITIIKNTTNAKVIAPNIIRSSVVSFKKSPYLTNKILAMQVQFHKYIFVNTTI